MATTNCLSALVFFINFYLVFSNFESPCPDIFTYDSDGSNVFGKIVLRRGQNGAPVSRLDLEASFSINGYVNDYGRLDLANEKHALQGYNQGHALQYRVHFPAGPSVPRISSITVNGNTVCSGPKLGPLPNQVVTSFMLKRSSYIQSAGQEPITLMQNYQIDTEPSFENDRINQNQNHQEDDKFYNNIFNYLSNQGTYEDPFSSLSRPASPERPSSPVRPSRPSTPTGTQSFSRPSLQANPSNVPVRPSRPSQPPLPTTTYYEKSPQQPTVPTTVTNTQRVNQQSQPQSNVECGTRSSANEKLPLIYGGKGYLRGDLPWVVALYHTKGGNLKFMCGGTLVSNRHVVTAAHCMHFMHHSLSINEMVIKVGVHNLNDWDDDITVTRTLIAAATHDRFNRSSLENDILVLTFNKRVEFNDYIRPACLWTGDSRLERVVGASGIVAGWGSQKKLSELAEEPKQVYLPIVSTSTCRSSSNKFHEITSDKTFCAGDRNGSGPCTGDSGGGMYLVDGGRWRLRGIVSVSLRSADGLCDLNQYVVFTDTAQYLPWIRQVLQKEYFD